MESDTDGVCLRTSIKGQSMWTLREKEGEQIIVCYCLRKNQEGEWIYRTEYETTPPTHLTCPKKHLDTAPEKCKDWRSRVKIYWEERIKSKAYVRLMFKQAQEENKKLFVEITAKEGHAFLMQGQNHKTAIFEIDSVSPGIKGRSNMTGLLYKIPTRLFITGRFFQKGQDDD